LVPCINKKEKEKIEDLSVLLSFYEKIVENFKLETNYY
jgi:hypothetical protein